MPTTPELAAAVALLRREVSLHMRADVMAVGEPPVIEAIRLVLDALAEREAATPASGEPADDDDRPPVDGPPDATPETWERVRRGLATMRSEPEDEEALTLALTQVLDPLLDRPDDIDFYSLRGEAMIVRPRIRAVLARVQASAAPTLHPLAAAVLDHSEKTGRVLLLFADRAPSSITEEERHVLFAGSSQSALTDNAWAAAGFPRFVAPPSPEPKKKGETP